MYGGGELGGFSNKFKRAFPNDLLDSLRLIYLEFRLVGPPLSALLQFFPEHEILLIVGSANVRVRLTVFRSDCTVLALERWL